MSLTDETESELLRRTVEGDRRAFEVLFDRHVRAVTRYAWALVGTRQDVEEVVQDTFIAGWQKAARIRLRGDSLLPWLLVTCRNHALNLLRRRRRHAHDSLEEERSLRRLSSHDDESLARARLELVVTEMAKLNELDRRICELCLIEGRSYREAAQLVGKSVAAVGKRLERSRLRLRKAVEGEY